MVGQSVPDTGISLGVANACGVGEEVDVPGQTQSASVGQDAFLQRPKLV